MGDPDADIVDNSLLQLCGRSSSRTLGTPGPTPQVYRPREKEPSYDETEWMAEVGNYFRGDEAAAEKILEEQFLEEERAGRMCTLSERKRLDATPAVLLEWRLRAFWRSRTVGTDHP